MKKFKQVICAIALVPVFSGATYKSNYDAGQVTYFSGSLAEAQQWAKSQGRYSIAFFHAKWCAPCQVMEEGMLRNPDLVSYINQNFVSTSIDIEQFDGVQAKQDNQIKLLPTVIVFDPRGQEVTRFEQKLSSVQLLSELKRINEASADNQIYHLPMPAPVSKPLYKADYNEEAEILSKVSTGEEAMPSKKTNLRIQFRPIKGYGLQIGCYVVKELAAADFIRTSDRFTKEKMMLFASKNLNADRYHVLFGPFATPEAAADKKKELAAQGIFSFVKDLSKMPASINH